MAVFDQITLPGGLKIYGGAIPTFQKFRRKDYRPDPDTIGNIIVSKGNDRTTVHAKRVDGAWTVIGDISDDARKHLVEELTQKYP